MLKTKGSPQPSMVSKNFPKRETFPHTPDYIIPVAPGEILKEKLDEMGMSVEQFVNQSGLAIEVAELFFIGRLPLTLQLAALLERITQIPTDNWIRHENGYRNDLKKAADMYSL